MKSGSFKIWRSPIVCWGFFALFLVPGLLLLWAGSQPVTKSYSDADRHILLLVGGVCTILAFVSMGLAWRAWRNQREG